MKSSIYFRPKIAAQARSSNLWSAKSGPHRLGLSSGCP
uniref:Uncharacterized protein n=1 Tax=Arundo donax TaxID=35708 RepID=A0A0A8Z5C1_ARUDO